MFFSGVPIRFALIEIDPLTANGYFLAAIVRLMGQALSLMISKIDDTAIDLANGAKIDKKLWSRLYLQHHKKRWVVESILFYKLVRLRHSNCEGTSDYVGELLQTLSIVSKYESSLRKLVACIPSLQWFK